MNHISAWKQFDDTKKQSLMEVLAIPEKYNKSISLQYHAQDRPADENQEKASAK